MNLRLKTRIALLNSYAGAAVTLVVFIAVYLVVYASTYNHLDAQIFAEKEEIFANFEWSGDSLMLEMSSEQIERSTGRQKSALHFCRWLTPGAGCFFAPTTSATTGFYTCRPWRNRSISILNSTGT
jgi:hypothetical protein